MVDRLPQHTTLLLQHNQIKHYEIHVLPQGSCLAKEVDSLEIKSGSSVNWLGKFLNQIITQTADVSY